MLPTMWKRICQPGELLLPMRHGPFEAARAQKTSLAIPDRPEDRRCLRGLCRLPGHRSQLGSDSMGCPGGLRRLRIARLFDSLDHYARGEATADQPCPRANRFSAACARTLTSVWVRLARVCQASVRVSGLSAPPPCLAERF